MKRIVGLVIIIAALILGSYYGMGVLTERTLRKNFDLVNQTNGVFVNIDKYQRGWFVSKADLSWRIHVPERVVKDKDGQSKTVPAQNFDMQMPLVIHHGPVIFANSRVKFGLGYANTNMQLPQTYQEKFNEAFTADSTKPKLEISLFVNYLNRSRAHFDLPQFTLNTKDGDAHFEWSGMRSDFSVSSNVDNLDGSITVDGIDFTKDKVKATVGKITSEYNLHRTASGLFIGDGSLEVPSFAMSNPEKKLFELEGFQVNSSSDIEADLFSSSFSTSVDKIFANDKTYGPGTLKLAIKNLDAEVLARLNQQLSNIQGTEEQRQQSLLAILPELPKLFSKGAEFEISELHFVLPEGAIEGNLLVALPKGDVGNPFQLIQKIKGDGKIKIPASVLKEIAQEHTKKTLQKQSPVQNALVQEMQTNTADQGTQNNAASSAQPAATDLDKQAAAQADKQLADLVQMGLLSVQGTDYVIELKLADGQLSVNGKPFNPATMKF